MVKRAPARHRPRKAKPVTKGLGPAECRLDQPTGSAAEVAEAIEKPRRLHCGLVEGATRRSSGTFVRAAD